MVQGSYTHLASEVKMKGQRRFPPGKACSLPPNKWYSRHLENGEKLYKFWRLKFVRFVDFFLGCGGREGLQIYALVNFTWGWQMCGRERPPSMLSCAARLIHLAQPQTDFEQRDFGIRLVLFSKKGKDNRLKWNKKTWRTRSHVLLNRTWK